VATSAHHCVQTLCLDPVSTHSFYAHTSDVDLVCSARGCRASATWSLQWNNPKLHPPERRKTWLACDEHLAYLTEFLQVRGFLRETSRLPSGQ
jgi:hypothetical protein